MTLPLKPETLAAAYEYLRSLPPFSAMKLPDSDDVEFWISKRDQEFGRYQWTGERHRISMSEKSIGHSDTLFRYLSHEMIHLHLQAAGLESKSTSLNVHNTQFRKIAARVCKIHGFDPKAFY